VVKRFIDHQVVAVDRAGVGHCFIVLDELATTAIRDS